jgi:hypothetical protein
MEGWRKFTKALETLKTVSKEDLCFPAGTS